jgi:hypothetical protein
MTVPNSTGYSDLGLTNVSDFSVTNRNGKSGLCCADLLHVYGTNNEYWEDSVMRDPELARKYTDTTAVDKKMNMYMAERKSFDPKEQDPFVLQQIMEDERNEKMMEKLRIQQLTKMTNYYDAKSIM